MMTNQTDKLLRECLGSGDPGAWLARHPEHHELLFPYLELHAALQQSGAPGPTPESVYRSHLELMHALGNQENVRQSRLARLPSAFMKLGTVAAAIALTLVAVAGASAAFGGEDVVGDVFSTLGFNSHADQGINNASPNAERGRDCASPNAFEGHGNAEDKAGNAADAHAQDVPRCPPNGSGEGQASANANDNASEGSGNADDGINNASPNSQGSDNANPNAFQGSGNADEGSGNANPNTSGHGIE